MGSKNHVINAYKAAVAAVHLSLLSIACIPSAFTVPPGVPRPISFGSQVSRWGAEYVGSSEVIEWFEHEHESVFLLDKYDELYDTFAEQA